MAKIGMIGFAAVLLSPAMSLMALAADGPSTTGVWKVDGDVMGNPVKMMCRIAEAGGKLTGSCSAAEDNYAPHPVSGKVNGAKIELTFQTMVQGTPIQLIMSGALNDDRSKVNGDLDVEPMGVNGTFIAVRMGEAEAAAVAAGPEAPAAAPSVAAAGAAPVSTGTWKVEGDVQGTPVKMTCALAEAEKKLSGTCSGAANDTMARKLVGEVTENGLTWHFDTVYEGSAITVAMKGSLSGDGTKMNGTMSVVPMDVDGTFVAVKQ